MKRTLKAPEKINKKGEAKLNRFFYLPGWQFESLIESKSTLIATKIIKWGKGEAIYAFIYGLRAVRADTGKPCFGNYFLHYGNKVYQFGDIEQAIEMVELLKKEITYDEYEKEIWQRKHEERQKLIAEKIQLKQLKPAKVKEVYTVG